MIPTDILKQFHFAFLIRHPKHSIPSYFRCTVPPLDEITGFYNFMPEEAGYDEQRRVFDYLRKIGQIGPKVAGQPSNAANVENGVHEDAVDICVIDADDLLDNPAAIVQTFCKSVGIEYSESLLTWDTEEDHKIAKTAFEKWRGFHEDAINSTSLRPRTHVCCILSRTESADANIFLLEKSREDRRTVLRRVGREVWRGGCKGYQAGRRGQRRRLRVHEAIRHQGLNMGNKGEQKGYITHNGSGRGDL